MQRVKPCPSPGPTVQSSCYSGLLLCSEDEHPRFPRPPPQAKPAPKAKHTNGKTSQRGLRCMNRGSLRVHRTVL